MSASPKAERQLEIFKSTIAWENTEPDCLIVCCSDHRYERQTRELAQHLDFKNPHVLQMPSGAVLTLPLASAINFLSKAADRIIERIVEMKRVKDIILVAHHDCGAYKSEKIPLVSAAIKSYTGKTVDQLQREHLVQAAHRMHLGLRGVRVRAFYASVVTEGAESSVRFEELPVR
jgi:carbonic anhydrase